ncbi:MAG: GAF domain-containing protein [Thermoplasmata archaeon]
MSPPIDKESLLAEILDAVLVCTKEGEILYSNPALGRMLGYPPEKIASKNFADDLLERDLEWKGLVSLLEQGGLIADYEVKLKRSDGSLINGSLSAINLRDANGVQTGIGAVLRDITTRKGVENELRETAFRIDVMNRIAKLASVETDVRRRTLVAMSEELRKLVNFNILTVGITEENGRHVEVILADPATPDAAKSLGKVLFEGSIVEKLKFGRGAIVVDKGANRKVFTEFSVMDIDKMSSMLCVPLVSRGRILGSLNLFHTRPNEYSWDIADTLQMAADQVAGLIDNMALLRTLENKYKLQETLVQSGVAIQKAINTEQIYATIAHHIKEVVPYTDLSFYLVNRQARMIYPVYAVGNFADEVMAAPGTIDEGVVGFVAKTGKAEFLDDVDTDPRVAQIPGVPKEHESMLALPLTGPDGVIGVLELYRPQGQVFTMSDLEAGKLFAQQASVALATSNLVSRLQDAKKEIEMLNDLMFHDINNFNFASMNYIEMVARSQDLPAEHKAHLEKSLQLVKQTAALIENVKKLTKIGVMNPQDFVSINLTDVLRKVVSGLENSFPEREVSVKLNIPESCYVTANPLVEELFLNLLSNSIKYDPHDSVEIDVDCAKTKEDIRSFWRICISDRGPGIPDSKKPLLFQKHVRLKPDSKIAGAGLGLSICRALTDKFGGRIWVEDRVPGRCDLGAKFCVVLPAAKEKET